MQIIVSLICGLLMSAGLIISGMINPEKVIGFLDIFGHFDPTLGFVMAGALLVTIVGYRWAGFYSKPLLCDSFHTPSKTTMDISLVLGAAIFGVGWGMVGFCPGPVIVAMGFGIQQSFVFVLAMLLGMIVAKFVVAFNKL